MSRQENGRKDLERWYLDRFLQSLQYNQIGMIEPSEGPDFLIATSNGKLGIELTRIYNRQISNGIIPREQEGLEDITIRLAEQKYKEKCNLPVYVHVFFNDSTKLTEEKANFLSDMLAMIVGQSNPTLAEYSVTDDNFELPDELNEIFIRRLPQSESIFWESPKAGWFPQLSSRQIEEEIARKEKKLILYRKKCNTTWLLLIIEGFGTASTLSISKEALTTTYTTGFNKIFLFRNFESKSHELRISIVERISEC